MGVDKELLRAKEKVTDIYGKTVRGGAYIFPKQSVDFCATVIQKYTSRDFKKLRSADFDEMAIDEVVFLVQGFCIIGENSTGTVQCNGKAYGIQTAFGERGA